MREILFRGIYDKSKDIIVYENPTKSKEIG